eukprot:scaffold26561_cov86-Phaeocystis_antarctica.AAC.2
MSPPLATQDDVPAYARGLLPYSCIALLYAFRPGRAFLPDTGSVRAEHAYSGTSWGALTLEVGKSPTEVPPGRRLPVAPPSAIIEFTSSSSCSWSPNRAVLETDANMVSRTNDQGARARPALGACATRPGHAVNMLTDERRSARHPGSASMQLHGTARHCRLLCQSLRALKCPPQAAPPARRRTGQRCARLSPPCRPS